MILIDPSSSISYYNLALLLQSRINPEPAIKAYKHALILDSGNLLAATNLGFLLHSMGRLKDAILIYKKFPLLRLNKQI